MDLNGKSKKTHNLPKQHAPHEIDFMRSSSNMSTTLPKASSRVMKLPNDLPIFCPLYYIYRFCFYLNEILGDINIFYDFCK